MYMCSLRFRTSLNVHETWAIEVLTKLNLNKCQK